MLKFPQTLGFAIRVDGYLKTNSPWFDESNYEDVIEAESNCTKPDAELENHDKFNQIWATAG